VGNLQKKLFILVKVIESYKINFPSLNNPLKNLQILHVHKKIYKECRRTISMTYTEIKERNGKKYFYRVLSIRNKKKVSKKRKYLGLNLNKKELSEKEKQADIQLIPKKKIDKKLFNKIQIILKKNKIKKAGIFGSYARGEQRKNSDIDILIQPRKDMGFSFAGLEIELSKKLKKKVDLITYNSINHLLKERILNQEVKII